MIFKSQYRFANISATKNPIFIKFETYIRKVIKIYHYIFCKDLWTLYDYPGFYTTLTLHYHHPSKEIQYQQYISCYWPNFNQTLKVSSWDQLEQLLNLTMTLIYIRNTSTVNYPTSTKMFGPNFFFIFFGPNSFSNEDLFHQKFLGPQFFLIQNLFGLRTFLDKEFFGPKYYWTTFFEPNKFWFRIWLEINFCGTEIFRTYSFFRRKISGLIFSWPEIFQSKKVNYLVSWTIRWTLDKPFYKS